MSEYMSVTINASLLASSSRNKLLLPLPVGKSPYEGQAEDMPGANICHMRLLETLEIKPEALKYA